MTSKPNIFISYARSDGLPFSRDLSRRLQEEGLAVWRDLTDIEGGRGWWEQIEEAIRSVEHLILVLSPNALKSKIIMREWRLARAQGVHVRPVLAIKDLDLSNAPRRLQARHIYDLSQEEQWSRLVSDLRQHGKTVRVPFMVGDVPEGFIDRPDEFEEVKRAVIDSKGDPVAITAALRGAGGYGKTALSIALCHDEDVQDAFQDGIIRVEVGENPKDMRGLVVDLIENLTGERPGFETLTAASDRLAEIIGQRYILLVIDDVWRKSHFTPFMSGGENCARLITTRDASILPEETRQVAIHAPKENEAVAMLSYGLNPEEVSANLRHIELLTDKWLKRWPLLVRLVNSMLRRQCNRWQRKLADALIDVENALTVKGLTVFDDERAEERTAAVSRTIEVSLEQLSEHDRERFSDLAIFPEDTDIPLKSIAALWQSTANLQYFQTYDLCTEFADLSLILDADLGREVIRFHDVIRAYLRGKLGPRQLAETHSAYVRHYEKATGGNFQQVSEEDRYYFSWLLFHLKHSEDAGYAKRIDELLLDYRWISSKLRVSGPLELVADYRNFATSDDAIAVGNALDLSLSVLASDPAQLSAQIIGRLNYSTASERLRSFVADIKRLIHKPTLLPAFASFGASGGEIRRLTNLESRINRFRVVDNERLLTASANGHIQLWNLTTAQCQFTFKEHRQEVTFFGLIGDELGVSGSRDGSTRVFRLATGEELHKRQWKYNVPEKVEEEPVNEKSEQAESGGDKRAPAPGYDPESLNRRAIDWRCEIRQVLNEVFAIYCRRGPALEPLKKTEEEKQDPSYSDQDNEYGGGSPISIFDLSNNNELTKTKSDFLGVHVVEGAWVIDKSRLLAFYAPRYGVEADSPFGKDRALFVLWNVDDGTELNRFSGDMFAAELRRPNLFTAKERSQKSSIDHLEIIKGDLVLVLSSSSNIGTCFDIQTGREAYRTEVGDKAFSFLRLDQETAAWTIEENEIGVFDLVSGEKKCSLKGHSAFVSGLKKTLEGHIVSVSNEGSVRLWDWKSGKEIRSAQLAGSIEHLSIMEDKIITVSHTSWTGSDNCEISILTAGTLKVLKKMDGLSDFTIAELLPDQRRLITLAGYGVVQLWSLDTSEARAREKRRHSESIQTVNLIPSQDKLHGLSGSLDFSLGVWNLSDGSRIHNLSGHRSWVRAVTVSADGKRAVSASTDSTAIVWDLGTGKVVQHFRGHVGPVNKVFFRSENEILTAAFDGVIRVWSIEDGSEKFISTGHMASILDFLPIENGRRAVSSAMDKTVRLWKFSSKAGFVCTGQLQTQAEVDRLYLVGSIVNANPLILFVTTEGTCFKIKAGNIGKRKPVSCLPDNSQFLFFERESSTLFARSGDRCEEYMLSEGRLTKVRSMPLAEGVKIIGVYKDYCLMTEEDRSVLLAHRQTFERICRVNLDSEIACYDLSDRHLLLGDKLGQLHHLSLVQDDTLS